MNKSKKILIVVILMLIFVILWICNSSFKWFSIEDDYFKLFGNIAIIKPGITSVDRETIASRPKGSFVVPDNELVKIKILIIPSSVNNINLINSGYLENIYVSRFNKHYSSKNGILYNKDKTILIRYPERKSGNYIIPETVIKIDSSAFWDCQNIKRVTITKNINELPSMLFYMNYSLEEVKIEGNIKDLPTSLFHGCNNLEKIELPDTIDTLSANSLEYSEKNTSINISENIRNIDKDAFDGLKYIENIEVDKDNPYYSSENGILFNKNKTSLIRCPIAKKGKIIIPSSVSTIVEGAFAHCDNIEYVEISNNVEKIENNTFRGCLNLKEVKFGEKIKSVDEYAFSYCSNLKSVHLNDSLETIGENAFFDTGKTLKEIQIPSNVTEIGEKCFDSFSDYLVTLKFKSRNTPYPTNNDWGNVKIIYE